ncbi:septum formation initiator family protein [uncultured Cohaesibacter sp.]|uniref:FtsB family cell division protein n=1 Tax=uncultured Cohaesibacter sp. TaxID=1002546 RepID=UPI0029C60FC5|nr:septum formation initiator family protein [uncultured Cohaesibacter sp.]
MATRQRKNSVLRQLVLPFFFLLILAYFVYHTLHGSFGVYALADMKVRADALEADLLSLRYVREAEEHRIALFRKETLDPDMMDERARAYLDVADPNEIVIFNN